MGTTTNAHRDTHGPLRRQRVRRWCTETRQVCPERRRTRSKKAELVLQNTLRLTECTTIRKKLRAVRHCCQRRVPAPRPTDGQRRLREAAEVVVSATLSRSGALRAIPCGDPVRRGCVTEGGAVEVAIHLPDDIAAVPWEDVPRHVVQQLRGYLDLSFPGL